MLHMFSLALWYTNWDMWGAVGQWIGGIGTIVAVIIALKQINETRRLQYELLKPDIDISPSYSDSSIILPDAIPVDLEFIKKKLDKIEIKISNTKQTPVTISKFQIFNANHLENKYIRKSVVDNFRYFIEQLKKGKIRMVAPRVINSYRLDNECSINKSLKPGDEYTIELNLSLYADNLVKSNVILLRARVSYTNSQSKGIYILLVSPNVIGMENFIDRYHLIGEHHFTLCSVIKEGRKAEKIFYLVVDDLAKSKKNQKLNKSLEEVDSIKVL